MEGTAEKVAELKLEEGEAPKDYDLLDLGRLGEGPFGAEGCGDRGEFYGLDEDSIDAESGVKMRAGQQQDEDEDEDEVVVMNGQREMAMIDLSREDDEVASDETPLASPPTSTPSTPGHTPKKPKLDSSVK